MKYAVDLHLHSALSPCAGEEMTPNNIVQMSILKGLDFIAVTDHNSAENLQAVCRCAEGTPLVVVPGMEVETSEEIHVVCLFPDAASALKVQHEVYLALPVMENREEIFGPQYIMDEEDRIVGKLPRMLLTATGLSLDEVFELVRGAGGVVVPAHVDRNSYSILSNLGMIPEHLGFRYLEVSRDCDLPTFAREHFLHGKYEFLRSSDAHNLGDILERESFIELEELSVTCLLQKLKG